MNKKILWIAAIALVLVIAGASVLYQNLSQRMEISGLATVATTVPATEATEAPTETAAETETPDYTAPDFSMRDWDGNALRLSDFRGKPVILNFWASWCGPCQGEMPEFEKAYQTYGEDIHFIMLNCTVGDSEEDAKKLIADNGYTFPVYFDTTGEASYTYGASSIPLTFFIDADGNLVTYARGALSGELLETGISYIYTEE